MNSIQLKIYFYLSLVITIATSCSDDLERFPYNNISTEQSFLDITDAEKWNNGLLATFRNTASGTAQFATDIQADQLNATINFAGRNGFLHTWNGLLSDNNNLRVVWQNFYAGISNANVALEGFEGMNLTDAAENAKLKEYKGSAYFIRAYYYFHLVNRFAKTYNPSTASTDLGVPLITKYDVNSLPARSTVAEIYNQVLADLKMAKELLSNTTGVQGSHYFNKDVVVALEARTKLHMQDWEGAKTAAEQLINSGTYPLITTAEELAKMWINDFEQEVIFMPYVSASNELVPSKFVISPEIYLGYVGSENTYTPDFLPSQWVLDMYEDTDYRKSIYFMKPDIVRLQRGDFSDVFVVAKFRGNPELFEGPYTNYQNAPKIFRIAEMYLIAAEAAMNISNANAAATALNALRNARGLSTIATPTMQDIQDERFRELAFEGFRLDDLKRWNLGFTRKEPQNSQTVTTGLTYDKLAIEANNPKFIWGIPASDILVNENLKDQQNPSW